MRIVTRTEREAANAKLHAKAEEIRAQMTPKQLAKLKREPHQSEREKMRRRKHLRWVSVMDVETCLLCAERDGLQGLTPPPHLGCQNPNGCRCTQNP